MVIIVRTQKRIQVVDVTEEIQRALEPSSAKAILVFVPHTTCALVLNEFEPNLARDFEKLVEEAYHKQKWRHDEVNDNAAAHVLNAQWGCSVVIPVEKGELALGTWQRILLIEMDGPRDRELWIKRL